MVLRIFLALVAAAIALLFAVGYREAVNDPLVRRVTIQVPEHLDVPQRILFVADFHVHRPDMSPSRLAKIVTKLNDLNADLVILGGDYQSDLFFGRPYSLAAAIEPLAGFRARYGVAAILGNHDQTRADAITALLKSHKITVLNDDARRFGPISVGGINQRRRLAKRRLMNLPGPRLLVAHTPEYMVKLGNGPDLFLAGHTHCGQIVLPFVGPLVVGARLPISASCGLSRIKGVPLIVTAGLGTSRVPIRIGTTPDAWLITLKSDGERE